MSGSNTQEHKYGERMKAPRCVLYFKDLMHIFPYRTRLKSQCVHSRSFYQAGLARPVSMRTTSFLCIFGIEKPPLMKSLLKVYIRHMGLQKSLKTENIKNMRRFNNKAQLQFWSAVHTKLCMASDDL